MHLLATQGLLRSRTLEQLPPGRKLNALKAHFFQKNRALKRVFSQSIRFDRVERPRLRWVNKRFHDAMPAMKPDDLQPTRHTLVQRLKDLEDQESWQNFFNTYWRLIYTVALRSGLTEAEAHDVVQETVLTVVKNIGEFQPGAEHGSFRSWLLHATRWRIADQFRKRARVPAQSIHGSSDPARTSTIERVPDPSSDDVARHWEEHWRQNLMDAAIENVKTRVDAEDYQLFDRHVLKGETAISVARRLGTRLSRVYLVKYRVSRMLSKEVRRLEKQLN
jgi:RNA polymerase sigma factor (sigma-70 family)